MSTHTLRLILGDQLNPQHSWFAQPDPGVVYVLMEVRQETDYVRHHAQKLIAVLAGLRDLARHLAGQGHRVHHIALDDPANLQSIPANLEALAAQTGASRIEYQLPDEWRLDEQLRTWRPGGGVTVAAVDTEHFLTARGDAEKQFGGRARWLMEQFYRRMRVRHGVLMDGEEPAGGRWNFDAENRKRWPGRPAEPDDVRPVHDHSALWDMLQRAGVDSFGDPQADRFRWPLNRAEALTQLAFFIEAVLPHFGDYQDAMSRHAPRLFHSMLSFALNVKMLHPREVIDAAEAAWRKGRAPLPAVEGFVRQILGWREYVRGVYWAFMPGYDERNALAHHTPLPGYFWTGQTRMQCLSHALGQSLRDAHAHHIQRLMVIGNFALLAGLDPAEVHRWYLGVYIDAFEWVELPNTLGMSQFADGGVLATKPYVSGAAYIHRMSDYCDGCAYNRTQRVGEGACPFNALYWDFFARHEPRLGKNPRLALTYKQLRAMPAEDRQAVARQADALRQRLDAL